MSIQANLSDQPLAVDLTDHNYTSKIKQSMQEAVESVYSRVMEKTDSRLSDMSTQIAAIHAAISNLASRNTGETPADSGKSRNTDEMSVDSREGRNTEQVSVDPVQEGAERTTSSQSVNKSRHEDDSISLMSGVSAYPRKRSSAAESCAPASSRRSSIQRSESPHSSTTTKRSRKNSLLEPEQNEWEAEVEQYQDKTEFGPEISSGVAGAHKIFWHRNPPTEVKKELLSHSKIPSNCSYMKTKRINKVVWKIGSGDMRTRDNEMQRLQDLHAATTATIMNATSQFVTMKYQLSRLAADYPDAQIPDVEEHLRSLKNALKLSGMVNQKANAIRREGFRASITQDLKEVIGEPDEQSLELFGDNLRSRIDDIKDSALIVRELKKKEFVKPVLKEQRRSNYETPQKSLSGSNNQGYQHQKSHNKNRTNNNQSRKRTFQRNNNNSNNYKENSRKK